MECDLRLEAAYRHIDRGGVKVLSLDIFDTLLRRKVPMPADIFLLLGHQLKKEGWLIEAVPPEAFVELRVKAEYIARSKKPEVTLQEIYWALCGIFTKITIEEMIEGKNGLFSEADVDDAVAIELALEKQLLHYDEEILKLAQYAARKKIDVVLISNTYFTQENIAFFLDPAPFRRIFLSCEYGFGKGAGLFAKMIEELNVKPEEILHIGDNFKADCQAALQLKIPSIYYQKYDPEFMKVLNLEWPESDLTQRKALLDGSEGDFGLTALRAKMHYDPRLKNFSKKEAFFWKYGASVLGPCLTGFTHWIYDRCREMKEGQVFCLMREGRLYHKLIQAYAPYYPQHKLRSSELWASRQFITHACMAYGTPQEIFAATKSHPASRFTYETFLAYLGLNIQKIRKLVKYRYVKLDDRPICEELAAYLSERAELKEKILERAAAKRRRFLNYLSTLADLANLSHMTLVDVGWSGTIQGALQAIFYLSGYPIKVHGLYLATAYDTDLALMQGFIREGYLMKANYPQGDVRVLKRGMYAMEQTALAGLGSLVDIDDQGQVITAESHMTPHQEKEGMIVQQGILAFCEALGKQNKGWNSKSENLIAELRSILVRSAGCPTKTEATAFQEWSHDHVSIQGTTAHFLGKSAYYDRFIKDMLPQFAFEDWGMTWPASYAAKHGEILAKTALIGYSRAVPPKCFLSIDEIPLKIFLDHGQGFLKKATALLPLKSNANRAFYAYHKLFSIKKPIQKIRLELHTRDSLIKIESLRLTVNYTTTPKTDLFPFFESDKKEKNLACSYPEKTPGLFASGDDPLVLTYDFENPAVYLVHLNLCFLKL